jgi:hypothetical protein
MLKDRWFLPTNTENLKIILEKGLIVSREGFTKKYYTDELENYPRHIPLFKGNAISQATMERVVSEGGHLKPCLIEIDLSKIPSIAEQDKESHKDSAPLLLLAPLPLSCVKQIVFQSAQEKNAFEGEKELYSNLVLAGLKLKCEEKLFSVINSGKSNTQGGLFDSKNEETVHQIFNSNSYQSKEVDYPKVYAFGALLSNLFYCAKNGETSNNTFKAFKELCTESKKPPNEVKKIKDIEYIYQYFTKDGGASFEPEQEICTKLVEKIISGSDFKNDVLNLLESEGWQEQQSQSATAKYAKKIREFAENHPNMTTSEKLSQAKTSLGKTLLMLFHREHSNDLMDFEFNDRFSVSEEDYMLFALLFGIRDGFSRTPQFIREYEGLQHFISYKMAEYAHYLIGNDVKFKAPREPKTVWNMSSTKSFVKALLAMQKAQGFIDIAKINIGDVNDEYFKIILAKKINTEMYNTLAKKKS